MAKYRIRKNPKYDTLWDLQWQTLILRKWKTLETKGLAECKDLAVYYENGKKDIFYTCKSCKKGYPQPKFDMDFCSAECQAMGIMKEA